MEKKDLGNKLIIIGLILEFSYLILFGLVDVYWNINYYDIINGTLVGAKMLTIMGCIIVVIINVIAIIMIVIGGRWAKIRFDYWLVLIGIILIMNSLSTRWLIIIIDLLGVSLISPYEILLTIFLIILIGTGIASIITGGLMKSKK